MHPSGLLSCTITCVCRSTDHWHWCWVWWVMWLTSRHAAFRLTDGTHYMTVHNTTHAAAQCAATDEAETTCTKPSCSHITDTAPGPTSLISDLASTIQGRVGRCQRGGSAANGNVTRWSEPGSSEERFVPSGSSSSLCCFENLICTCSTCASMHSSWLCYATLVLVHLTLLFTFRFACAAKVYWGCRLPLCCCCFCAQRLRFSCSLFRSWKLWFLCKGSTCRSPA